MAKPRRILTNFSKGELSPNLEGRPDLAAYFEGCQTLENWLLLRQGGITRRPGTRFVAQIGRSVWISNLNRNLTSRIGKTLTILVETTVTHAHLDNKSIIDTKFKRNQDRIL